MPRMAPGAQIETARPEDATAMLAELRAIYGAPEHGRGGVDGMVCRELESRAPRLGLTELALRSPHGVPPVRKVLPDA